MEIFTPNSAMMHNLAFCIANNFALQVVIEYSPACVIFLECSLKGHDMHQCME